MKKTTWIKALLIALSIAQALNLGLIPDEWSRKVISDLLQALVAIIASITTILASARLRRESADASSGWTLISIAAFLFAVGMIAFMYVEVVLKTVPYPSFAEVFFLIFDVFMIMGILCLPQEKFLPRERLNVLLDVFALAIVASMFIWHFNLRILLQSLNNVPTLGVKVSLVYTILESILLILIFYRLVRRLGEGRQFIPILCLVIGCFFLISADQLQGYMATLSGFTSGSPIDMGWVLFSTFLGLAALYIYEHGDSPLPEHSGNKASFDFRRSIWTVALTYLWIAMALVMLLWAMFNPDKVNVWVLISGLLGAIVLAVTRQVNSLRENAVLFAELQNAHVNLEKTVHERTDELEREIEVHKQTEKFLLRSEEEAQVLLSVNEQLKKSLGDILDTLPSIIARVNSEGRVDLVNRRFEQFSGISSDSAYGMALESLIPHFTTQLQQIPEVIARQTPVNIANIQHRNGKELHYYSLQIYPLNGDASDMAVVRIDDITEHVRIEEIMMQTEKMMMVGGLAAGMAHEINNPLGIILQNAENIERRFSQTLPANAKTADELGVSLELVRAYLEKRSIFQFVSYIRDAAIRASGIITNLLHYSRQSESYFETITLSTVIDRVLELASTDYAMKKQYDFRRIELVREYAAEMPPVTITVPEVEQVFLNIIKNAAQAMSEDDFRCQPRITVRTSVDNNMAVITFEDNGPGMDEATRSRIFEPFFSTKDVGIGTGLGLSVAYAIITKGHGGSIEVRSQVGHGSCFTIKLPIQGRS